MKKRKNIIFLSILFTLLTLTACTGMLGATKLEAVTQQSPQASIIPESTLNTLIFTKQQVIADFNSIVDVMDKNYPHFISAREMYGSNKYEIIERYGTALANLPDEVELPKVIELFYSFFNEFGKTAHLYLFNYDLYKSTSETAEEILNSPEYDSGTKDSFLLSYELINSDTVKTTYNYLKDNPLSLDIIKKTKLTAGSETPVSIEDLVAINENLSYKVIDSVTVYLRIASFDTQYIETDKTEVLNFYKKFAEYNNLIIDITENNGGSDWYWQQNIIAPNISSSLHTKDYGLYKSAGIYKESADDYSMNRESETYKSVSNMPEINKEILADLDLADVNLHTVEPDGFSRVFDGRTFDGRIYVLTGKGVYSASEGFAAFCKETGFAELAGYNTGGDGNGYLAIKQFACPNTGLLYQFSTRYVLNNDGSSNTVVGTKPDYYAQEGESALDACLRIIEKAD